ncbi:MAG: hypothetical protein AAGD96_26555 [Chloroflexota bacterium]
MSIKNQGDLGFVYHVAKNGNVLISHHGRLATTLRGSKASIFVDKLNSLSFSKQQHMMAKVTGNYKRGNERTSKKHPKNR